MVLIAARACLGERARKVVGTPAGDPQGDLQADGRRREEERNIPRAYRCRSHDREAKNEQRRKGDLALAGAGSFDCPDEGRRAILFTRLGAGEAPSCCAAQHQD